MKYDSPLEEQMMQNIRNNEKLDIERSLLIISGLETEKEISIYQQKLDQIQDGFHRYAGKGEHTQLETAMFLFDYLWLERPDDYSSSALANSLTYTIDEQLHKNKENVGLCNGLTALYSVLGIRENLDLSILIIPDVNQEMDGHVMNRLRYNGKALDIDNTNRTGFGIIKKGIIEFPIRTIISTTYNNRGQIKRVSGDDEGALEDIKKAIEITDHCICFYFSRGTIRENLKDYPGALEDFDRTLEIDPESSPSYINRGIVKINTEDFKGAEEDFTKALKYNQKSAVALINRGIVRAELGRSDEGIRDLDLAIQIEPDNFVAYLNRGSIREETGNHEGADADYEMLKKVNPEFDESLLEENTINTITRNSTTLKEPM